MTQFLLTDFPAVSSLQHAIREDLRVDEGSLIARLLAAVGQSSIDEHSVKRRAEELVLAIRREQQGKGGVDALLKEFSLSTEEGIVLMCLAEALLRVPDNATANELIRDKLMSGNWSSHLGQSDSLFVNASSWGLLMTGKVTRLSHADPSQHVNLLQKTLGRLGEPVIRTAMKSAMEIMGTQFVLGTNIRRATQRARKRELAGYCYSYDMLGEGARTDADAKHYLQAYRAAISVIGEAKDDNHLAGISVKLSALHPRYEPHQDLSVLIERALSLAVFARSYGIGFTIDAEEASRLDISLGVIEAVFTAPETSDWDGFGIAVQVYQKRAPAVVDWAIDLARRTGQIMNIRLVKGAYWDSEIKWAQQEGLFDYPVFTRKPATDLCYQVCAEKLLRARPYVFPQFATHNAQTVATVLALDDEQDDKKGTRQGYEFQRLHGMGESLYDVLMATEPVRCRIYAPVGEHKELLAYLVRRLLENGANSSFVNNIIDETIPVERLTEDPVALVQSWQDTRSSFIPLPKDLYRMSARESGTRANARGWDLADDLELQPLKIKIEHFWENRASSAGDVAVMNPATGKLIGQLQYATEAEMLQAVNDLTTAPSAPSAPSAQSAPSVPSPWDQQRAATALRQLASLLEEDVAAIAAFCMQEAGKTLADSVAEIREAVDFCRYYADRAEALPSHFEPLGIVLCISPWNFPVAIFLGQVAAALSVGNQVIGKPAEQTSLVARHLTGLMRQAGIPASAFQLVTAKGSLVGQVLVPHSAIAGVMFTGSDGVARSINRSVSSVKSRNGPIPLIAETGGLNAMIVDSTALFEQVVDDVMQSGFNSAGQRCSALRVLYVQEDVADRLITMIEGAMGCLKVGDPSLLSTDIGPVIDQAALQRLEAHVQRLQDADGARVLFQGPIPSSSSGGYFFPPTLIELDNTKLLQQEVFGPIVHIVRFKRSELEQVIAAINSTGFGLTFAIHSRIAESAMKTAAAVSAGNIYVNRNMVGAIVGVQPFGGRGMSGTGPKAGGPNYLYRLVKRRLVQNQIVKIKNPGPRHANGFNPELSDPAPFNGDIAASTFKAWSSRSYAAREVDIRPQLNKLPDAMAKECGAICEIARGLLTIPHLLPGPTGEDDQLSYEAKGLVAILPLDDPLIWWSRVIAVLITGNVPVLVDAETRIREVFSGLSEHILYVTTEQLSALFTNPMVRLVLGGEGAGGSEIDAASRWCCQKLAQQDSAIVPYCSLVDHQQLVRLLLNEKVISIDTTAAGGNATLLNAAGRDEGLEPTHGQRPS